MKLDYLLRETGTNLRRNITLAIASVVTVAVSLSLLGVALVVQKGVDQATQRWQDGVEFIVFMQPEATAGQLSAIEGALEASPEIERWRFVDQNEAYEEFEELFSDDAVLEIVSAADLPSSFRVVPAGIDADRIEVLAEKFEDEPGVRHVDSANDVIRKFERASTIVRLGVLVAGISLLGASVLLIINTIRMAMFARRREIEVMKLVGATNWFIRVPFMIEGLVQGLVGGAISVAAVYGVNEWFRRWLSNDDAFAILESFAVDNGFVWAVGIALLAIGCGVGALGSGVALNRFLDV